MPKFRKKPIVIEAVQLRWTTWEDVCTFLGTVICSANPARIISADEASDTCGESGPGFIALTVTTTHGEQAIVRHGDWILPDSKPGTFYPCKPDVFAATYESIPLSQSQTGDPPMKRKLVSHVVGACNEAIRIEVIDGPDAGGASTHYKTSILGDPDNHQVTHIQFHVGPLEPGVNGITNEVLLAIVEDRLLSFQAGPYACVENEEALLAIRAAMNSLHSRTRDRMARGVEGRPVR